MSTMLRIGIRAREAARRGLASAGLVGSLTVVAPIAVVALVALVALGLGGCSDATKGTGNTVIDAGGGIGADASDEDAVQGIACSHDSDCATAFAELAQCEVAVCSPTTGVCVVGAAEDGSACTDGFPCTGPDFCLYGKCGGGARNCDDQDPCTKDYCDGKTGCVHSPLTDEPCDDGDPCTTDDRCVEGACTGGTHIDGCCQYDAECQDDDLCTDDKCEDHACTHPFNYAPCDDANPCTIKDHCDGAGACGGEEIGCDDGNPCTVDACDPATGVCGTSVAPDGTVCEDGNPCTNPDACEAGLCVGQGSLCQCTADADCVAFEDGDLCNGPLKCLDFLCVVDPITVVACNPTGDTACVNNQCDPATGQCVPQQAPSGTACDDQNPCTDSDSCTNGLCVGTPLGCDDGNPCTFDACSVETCCTNLPNTLPCDDGDACTANDQCANAVCGGAATLCDDGNPCTDDACDPSAGCVHTPNTASCEDGNPCTDGDTCAGGACAPGANTCQCQTDGDCAPQEDGDLCNGTLVCQANNCVIDPATVVTCNTTGDTACLHTVCAPATGQCVPQPAVDGAVCDDGNACTTADACLSGVCVGAAADCDDGNACTDDVCDPATGCAQVPNVTPCDDGDPCTGNDRCADAVCAGVAVSCDDGNPCTVDSCASPGGCQATAAADGTPCDDGNPCTVSDACVAGQCGGQPRDCDDDNPCTADTCVLGCVNTAVADGTPCDDANACSQGDHCTAGTCAGNPPSCDDGDPCTLDTCDATLGCTYSSAPDGTGCSDGDPCTGGDACQAASCVPGAPICGCQDDADCASEEDGDLCNGTLRCGADHQCKVDPATVVTCDAPANPCHISVCQASTGACVDAPGNEGATCDDGDGCTDNDLCVGGSCVGFSKACDDGNPCTADSCASGACTHSPAFDGQPCAEDGESCTLDVCQGGSCGHLPVADGVTCADDGNSCTEDLCASGTCAHPPVPSELPCTDDGNTCTYDQCADGTCQHISNDPAPVGTGQCFPVQELQPNTGVVTGGWADCGTADQFVYKCKGPKCSHTGAITTWPCADPSFLYDGADTGYEYAYVFVAPSDGTCTFYEYDEGVLVQGSLFATIDWFILSGGSCDANSCIDYVWETHSTDPASTSYDPACKDAQNYCSYKEFQVSQGQVFYVVADIFDGLGTSHVGYGANDTWSIEMKCNDKTRLLLNEDFTDSVCNGCTTSVSGVSPSCKNFGWHAIGGFDEVVTGYYLGDLQNTTLAGYDCGATTATVTFPAVTLPADATSCHASVDYYARLDAADDGSCTNDIFTAMLAVGATPAQPITADACAADTTSSNPIGTGADPPRTMTWDITSAAGSAVTLSFDWSADAANNAGLGVILDNVQIVCEVP